MACSVGRVGRVVRMEVRVAKVAAASVAVLRAVAFWAEAEAEVLMAKVASRAAQ